MSSPWPPQAEVLGPPKPPRLDFIPESQQQIIAEDKEYKAAGARGQLVRQVTAGHAHCECHCGQGQPGGCKRILPIRTVQDTTKDKKAVLRDSM